MISGLVILVPEILYLFMNVSKITSAFTYASRSTSNLFRFRCISGFLAVTLPSHLTSSRLFFSLVSLLFLWTGPPTIASFLTFIWIMSILLSRDQGSYVIVIILQRCGLLAARDSRTPPVLNAIYEQITRIAAGYSDLVESSDLSYEDNEEQTIADCSPDSSHLADGRDPHKTLVQTEDQEREAHDEQSKKHRLNAQHIYAQLVDAQDSLRQQLELSRAREQKLDADLLAAQQEHESFKALVPTLEESDRKRRAWEIIATNARACSAETVFKLRAELTAAVDRVRDLQGQLDRQAELVQSITEESQVAHVKLKNAEAKLQREQDHRRTVRHDLDQSRGLLREVKTRIRSLQAEWDTSQALLRDAQNARCADMIKLAEVLEHLRASRAESKSSMAEAERSRFRCSQATFLCAALQERVAELEAEVKKLKYSARACPMDTCPALPYLLDLTLPPSPSYSISNTIPLSQLEAALEPPDVLDKAVTKFPRSVLLILSVFLPHCC
ncbi:hypothetical protein BJV77DRAFT_770227 [Russula vinacea]|nr:hypothetical protein BJV77DRAFT_770227 [Russula vinacea]